MADFLRQVETLRCSYREQVVRQCTS